MLSIISLLMLSHLLGFHFYLCKKPLNGVSSLSRLNHASLLIVFPLVPPQFTKASAPLITSRCSGRGAAGAKTPGQGTRARPTLATAVDRWNCFLDSLTACHRFTLSCVWLECISTEPGDFNRLRAGFIQPELKVNPGHLARCCAAAVAIMTITSSALVSPQRLQLPRRRSSGEPSLWFHMRRGEDVHAQLASGDHMREAFSCLFSLQFNGLKKSAEGSRLQYGSQKTPEKIQSKCFY